MEKIKGSPAKIKPEIVLRPQRCDILNRFQLHIGKIFLVSKLKRQNQKHRTIKSIRNFFPNHRSENTSLWCIWWSVLPGKNTATKAPVYLTSGKVFLTVAHHSGKEVKQCPLMTVKSLDKKHVNWYKERHKEEREKGKVIKEEGG